MQVSTAREPVPVLGLGHVPLAIHEEQQHQSKKKLSTGAVACTQSIHVVLPAPFASVPLPTPSSPSGHEMREVLAAKSKATAAATKPIESHATTTESPLPSSPPQAKESTASAALIIMNNNSIIDYRTCSSNSDNSYDDGEDPRFALGDQCEDDDLVSIPIILADHRPKIVAWNKLLNCFFCAKPEEEEHNQHHHQQHQIQKVQNEHKKDPFRALGLRGLIRRHSSRSMMESVVMIDKEKPFSNHQEQQQCDSDHCEKRCEQEEEGLRYQQQHHQYLYYQSYSPHFFHHQQMFHSMQHQNPYEFQTTVSNRTPYPMLPVLSTFQNHHDSVLFGHHFSNLQQSHKQAQHSACHDGAGDNCEESVVSDVTESETSSYLSFSDDDEDNLVVGQVASTLELDQCGTDHHQRLAHPDKSSRNSGLGLGLKTNRQSAFRIPSNTKTTIVINGEADATNAVGNNTVKKTESSHIAFTVGAMSHDTANIDESPRRPRAMSTRATTIGATAANNADPTALNLDTTISRPNVMSIRSRSVAAILSSNSENNNKNGIQGLPPLMPSSSGHLDCPGLGRAHARRRCDTSGDETFITRTSVTTTGSRHRRDKQFVFSDDSMSEVWKQEWAVSDDNMGGKNHPQAGLMASHFPPPSPPPSPPPPHLLHSVPLSYVTFKETSTNPTARGHFRRVSDVSALAMSSSFGTNGRNFDFDQIDLGVNETKKNESGNSLIPDDDSNSPFAELESMFVDNDGECLAPIDDTSKGHQSDQPKNIINTHSSPISSKRKKDNCSPQYLRRNAAIDETTEGHVVLSGWLAVAFHDDPSHSADPEQKVVNDEFPSSPDDIFYLRIIVTKDRGQAKLLLQRSCSQGEIEHSFTISCNWICQSRDTTRSMGRCVLVRLFESTLDSPLPPGTNSASLASKTKVLVLLPVSLDSSIYNDEKALVSKMKFRKLRNNLFPTDRAGFAPDQQVVSAMHVMFTLDSLIKRYGIGSPPPQLM